jgi:Zn-dependent protease/CBS domain-containing protein
MSWSWKIARIAGIDIYAHATFVMLLAWIGVAHWLDGRSVSAVVEGLGFVLSLFGCVVLHEYGHALTAARYGIKTRDITLLPIGGVARLERMPERPRQELWVALAGPAVNVVLAALLFAWLRASGDWQPMRELSVARGDFLERLMVINGALALFNMLPAFPMDGGRVLRALLAIRLPYTRATELAALIGQGMAILFGVAGLFGNPFLIFIAFFVWIGAGQEASMVQMKSALAGIPVRDVMITDFTTLTPTNTIGDAVELVLSGSQQDFPVLDGGVVEGLLTRGDLVAGLRRHPRETPIGEIMRRNCSSADATDMLETVLAQLTDQDCRTWPVLYRGALVGLLTMDNVGEYLMFRTAEASASDGRRNLRAAADPGRHLPGA